MAFKLFFLSLFVGCALQSNAQGDSVNHVTDSLANGSTIVPDQQTPSVQHDAAFKDENMIRVQADQAPPALKKTLMDPQYRGWESGILERDIQSGEFRLEFVSGSEKQILFFDRQGERKTEK